jgi:hypothetical protein
MERKRNAGTAAGLIRGTAVPGLRSLSLAPGHGRGGRCRSRKTTKPKRGNIIRPSCVHPWNVIAWRGGWRENEDQKEDMDPQAVREQVEKNYEAFRALPPSVLALHQDKYALMKDGQVVGFYSSLEDAYVTANRFYKDQPFSVQKVTDVPVDLGFFSHAVPGR